MGREGFSRGLQPDVTEAILVETVPVSTENGIPVEVLDGAGRGLRVANGTDDAKDRQAMVPPNALYMFSAFTPALRLVRTRTVCDLHMRDAARASGFGPPKREGRDDQLARANPRTTGGFAAVPRTAQTDRLWSFALPVVRHGLIDTLDPVERIEPTGRASRPAFGLPRLRP